MSNFGLHFEKIAQVSRIVVYKQLQVGGSLKGQQKAESRSRPPDRHDATPKFPVLQQSTVIRKQNL